MYAVDISLLEREAPTSKQELRWWEYVTVNAMYTLVSDDELLEEYETILEDNSIYLYTVIVTLEDDVDIENLSVSIPTEEGKIYEVEDLGNSESIVETYLDDNIDLPSQQYAYKSYLIITSEDTIVNTVKSVDIHYNNVNISREIAVYISIPGE